MTRREISRLALLCAVAGSRSLGPRAFAQKAATRIEPVTDYVARFIVDTRYEDIRYTDDIPASIFNAAIPAGFVTVHGRSYQEPRMLPNAIPDAGFKPVTPKYLPEGFVLSGADVSNIKGLRSLHLIYSDGIRTLSLFENATDRAIDFAGLAPRTISFDKHDGQYVRDGPTTLLAWREEGLAFALVGDLDLKELVQIATSVVP